MTNSMSDEEVAQFLASLFAAVRGTVEELDDLSKWEVAPGSDLGVDDAEVRPFEVSHFAHSTLGIAADHVHAMANLVEVAHTFHAFAPYSLARGALETAAASYWLLQAPSRAERLTRRLRLAYDDAADDSRGRADLEIPELKSLDERRARILEVGSRAGLDAGRIVNKPRSTEILEAANNVRGAARPLGAWRVCSGFAHGKQWSTLLFMNREDVASDVEDRSVTVRVSSGAPQMAWTLSTALGLIGAASKLYRSRAQVARPARG